jgi:organic radical activating enzyme
MSKKYCHIQTIDARRGGASNNVKFQTMTTEAIQETTNIRDAVSKSGGEPAHHDDVDRAHANPKRNWVFRQHCCHGTMFNQHA